MTTKNVGTLERCPEKGAREQADFLPDATIDYGFDQLSPAFSDDSWLNNPNRIPLAELPLEEALSIVWKMAADSWLKGIDRTPFTELPPEVRDLIQCQIKRTPVRIQPGDEVLMDRLGHEEWFKLAIRRPVPEWAKQRAIQRDNVVIPFPQSLSAARQTKRDFPHWEWLTEEYIAAYERLAARGGAWLTARSSTLERLYSIFGDAVLIPVKPKSKAPVDAGWNTLTFADTQDAAYQGRLMATASKGGNIGLVLGPSSGGIMSIDIDRDLDRFLQLNPRLNDTTRTQGRLGRAQFFIRLMPGCSYPNSKAVYALKDANGQKYGEWRCGGGGLGAQSVVFGVHPEGMNYQFIVDNPPITIDWNDIKWFAPWSSPAASQAPPTSSGAATAAAPAAAQMQQLFAEFGEPFIQGSRKSYNVNEPFFARLWGLKRIAFYDRRSEDFYCYNPANGLFERLRDEQVMGLIRSDIFAEAFSRGFLTVGAKIKAAMLGSIAKQIKADEVVCKTDFFAPDLLAPPVIHAANGMIVIENDKAVLRPFDPKYRSRNRIPLDYIAGASCVHLKTDLLAPVLSNEDIDLLQRYCGLILIGGNRAQKILMMIGEGGTGKGTIDRLISLIIGRSNVVQLRVDQLKGRFETARVVGKLLLNVVEATANYLNREGAEVIKALVGGDPMEAEKKYCPDPISFDGTFPVIVTSNEALNVRLAGDESAQERRMAIIDFPTKRPSGAPIIENFEQLLYDQESEGIFAWMIEGAILHWKELKAKKGFGLSDTQRKRVEELIGRSKSIETFVTTQLEATGTDTVTTEELYDGYCSFCISKKWTPFLEQHFEQTSRYIIQREFGIGKRTDIPRPNANGRMTNRRGYSGMKIK